MNLFGVRFDVDFGSIVTIGLGSIVIGQIDVAGFGACNDFAAVWINDARLA